ncbi:MAG: SLC13 family permease [Alteromonadaceae bacterium]|nr:MAG: SLC13 family permease [Alteromonadaceae bacterium]
MTFDAYLTLAVLAFVVAALVWNKIAADLVLMAALTMLIVFGVLEPAQALLGFANPGVITIATLYVIASALIETGAVSWLASILLGTPKSVARAQLRLFFPTAFLSAFTNNTTIVAMFIPAVQEWGDKLNYSTAKLLIPLSYAAILGGLCTLIGTSTNLIVDGLLQQQYDIHLGLFEIAAIGLPIALCGAVYLYFFADMLLPNRGGVATQVSEFREYCVEFTVVKNGGLDGKSIAHAGLRNLNSGYLMEIIRGDEVLVAIDPSWTLQTDDVLVFIGAPELATELRRNRGLIVADHDMAKLDIANNKRCIVEVVLGPEFPAIGQTIKDSKFRTRFNAVILSLSREGKRQPGKLGSLKFKVGDTLLIETSMEFVEQYRFRKDFLLVSPLNNSTLPNHDRAPAAMGILLLMIISTLTGLTSLLESAFLAAGALLATGCVNASKARRQIDLQVLIVIAASLALGVAMNESGAAKAIADMLMPESIASPMLGLIIVYLLTVVFTEVITNNAAAVLMFPIAQSYSDRMDVSIMPFAITIMIAASASFMTPLGYQTNLMVYGPGQYRYTDYIKIGFPLSVLVALITLTLVPHLWDF